MLITVRTLRQTGADTALVRPRAPTFVGSQSGRREDQPRRTSSSPHPQQTIRGPQRGVFAPRVVRRVTPHPAIPRGRRCTPRQSWQGSLVFGYRDPGECWPRSLRPPRFPLRSLGTRRRLVVHGRHRRRKAPLPPAQAAARCCPVPPADNPCSRRGRQPCCSAAGYLVRPHRSSQPWVPPQTRPPQANDSAHHGSVRHVHPARPANRRKRRTQGAPPSHPRTLPGSMRPTATESCLAGHPPREQGRRLG